MAEKSSEGTQSARGSQAAAAAASGAQAQSPQSNQGSREQQREQREQQREQREQQVGRRPTDLQRRSSAPMAGTFGFSPFSLMRRLMDDMDLMFEDFGSTRGLGGGLLPRGLRGALPVAWSPAIEVFQRDGQLVVRADLPGLSPEDVRIEVSDDSLIIEGERRQEVEVEDEDYYRAERTYGRFSRVIALPDGADTERAQARFENGVLEVSIPLSEQETGRRRVEIQGTSPAGSQQQSAQQQSGQTGSVH